MTEGVLVERMVLTERVVLIKKVILIRRIMSIKLLVLKTLLNEEKRGALLITSRKRS